MKYFLFFILFFGLPHQLWFPLKLGISDQNIFIGVGNVLLIIALFLWASNFSKNPKIANPFKSVTIFIIIVTLGIGVAFINSFENEFLNTLINSKREISLLLLYFIPLATIKDKKDFKIFLAICLVVHFLVGVETFRSGVLEGSAFHDGKRGAGPFGVGWGWEGADVAAGYLAQTGMFYLGIMFGKEVSIRGRTLSGFLGAAVMGGLLATYARGALLAAIFGFIVIILAHGIKTRYLVIAIIFSVVSWFYLPASIITRFSNTTTESGVLDEGSQGRLLYFEKSFQIIKDYPLMGVGTAQIRPAMEKYVGKYVDPHNGFLYTVGEYGAIGFISFLFMLGAFMKASLEIFRDETVCPLFRNYALGMFGMLASLLVCNMFYANFYKELVLGTLMIHFGMLSFIKRYIES